MDKKPVWQGKERRRHPRKGVWLEIYYEHLGDFFQDYAINLSHGGLFIKTARPVPIGTELKLRFTIPGKKEVIETTGRVVRVVPQDNPQGHPPGIGIEFKVLSERDIALINTLWEEHPPSVLGKKKALKVKRCPKCQLVHSDTDYICKRCRVDLTTGEPVALPLIKTTTPRQVLEERARALVEGFKKPVNWLRESAKKLLSRIPTPQIQAKESTQIESLIYCLECGGQMKPATVPFYPRKILYPFLGLSMVFFGLSFWFPGLLLTGILSLACFVVYLRLRQELWLCSECGHFHPRRKKTRKSSGQGKEIRPGAES